MNHTYFITGIGTDVGKTVAAAVITEALKADYWKPVQAGDLENSDTHKVKRWVRNGESVFHDSAFNLNTPMSPHAAAEIDNVAIDLAKVIRPKTNNHLVIEGAGGLLVPLNAELTVADLIRPSDRIIVISRHYLGSINHTLLTIEALKKRNLEVFGMLFMGDIHPTTESIIATMSEVPILGRMDEEPYIDTGVISEYAELLSPVLQ